MIYALRHLKPDVVREAKECGIELKPEQNVIIYGDTVTRFKDHATTSELVRHIRGCVKDFRDRKAAELAAKQTNLLEDNT